MPEVTVFRRGYTRRGPHGREVYVPPTAFHRSGTGRGHGVSNPRARFSLAKGYRPWITRQGKLGGPGYLHRSPAERHHLLARCVAKYGYRSCLGSVAVLERPAARSATQRAKLAADRHFLSAHYGGPGSFVRHQRTHHSKYHSRLGGAEQQDVPRVRSPLSGRLVRVGGAAHRRLVAAGHL